MPLFNRRLAATTTTSSTPVVRDDAPQRKSTLFGHRNRSLSPSVASQDPSIPAARERVVNAEKKEKGADHALAVARTAVREARYYIKFLEKEAAEEARLAKIKQSQAKSISKR
ncbi:hypothetical protein BKA61DRAFT_742152 [Leptodontidium sp. MPI-SDFR-AT-0119]|nr:hypothetical protein BKA61DRAFT_742152 [Leptodontidium sp. MPI-SDFR-AT-0119]